MVRSAVSDYGSGIINSGLAQPDGSTVDAIAIAAQLNTGAYSSWYNLFHSLGGDSQYLISALMYKALLDMSHYGWAGAVYHVYNEAGDIIISFIFNGVTGTVSALPSS